MSSQQPQTDDSNGQPTTTTEFSGGQTSPLRLTDYDGCDHRGKVKIEIDDDTLPSDVDDDVEDDLNWAIEALNAVIHHPNLVLWVRGASNDLLLAYDAVEGHERAGHVRAATFNRSTHSESRLNIENEIDAGLLTPFDAVNVLYDYIVGESYFRGYSMMLTDVQYLEQWDMRVDHPILSMDDGVVSWGRHQLKRGSFPRPTGRKRTAYPESAYLNEVNSDAHEHAADALKAHLLTFAPK